MTYADVAELVDALVSGTSVSNDVEGRTAGGSSDGNKLLKTGFQRRFCGVANGDRVLPPLPLKLILRYYGRNEKDKSFENRRLFATTNTHNA